MLLKSDMQYCYSRDTKTASKLVMASWANSEAIFSYSTTPSMRECPKMHQKRLRSDVSATIGQLDTLPN